MLRHFFTMFKSQKVNFRSSVYGSSRACRCWPLNFFLVIDKGQYDIFTPIVDVIKNLQEVTGRTSSPAWNLWKPFTYCSIKELFQGSYSFKFERWHNFYIADQDTARYSLCSARENCVSWAEPLKCTADNLFSSRVFLLNLWPVYEICLLKNIIIFP